MTSPAEDELTELVGATFPRVDLVGKAANGVPRFLIAKSADGDDPAGLLGPDYVRDLISKSGLDESEPAVAPSASGVTLSGSPAEMAAFIHKAAQRAKPPADDAEPADLAKAEMSSRAINDLPYSDFAFIESGGTKDDSGKTTPRSKRHFPVHDASHTRNALSRAPQSPFGEKAMPKIRSAARKFGIEVAKALAEAGLNETEIAKAMALGGDLDEGIDGLDPTVPLAAPESGAPGDPADPGSPAWEAIDAATAQKWISIASRLRNALGVLADRELIEAATADPGDMCDAMDLQDAQCAVDYVISTLAVFAAGEQAEVDLAAEAVAKAMNGFDAAPLELIEGLAPVAKAGRVLSSVNESRIRDAAASLQQVLATLPAPAPDPDEPVAKQTQKETTVDPATPTEPEAADVAKADATPEQQAQDAGPVDAGGTTGMGIPKDAAPETPPGRAVMKAAAPLPVAIFDHAGRLTGCADASAIVTQVTKADGDGGDDSDGGKMQAVFDQNGCLIGVVNASAITPVDVPGSDEDAGDGGDADMPPEAELDPQPPADAGTPARDVAKAGTQATETAGTSTDQNQQGAGDVIKSIAEAVAAQLDGREPAEDVAKSADVAALLEEVGVLKARLTAVEGNPAAPKTFSSGQVPPAHMLRGQDRPGGQPAQVDVAKAAQLRTEFRNAEPAEQNRLAGEMQAAAIDHLAALHGRR